MENIVVLLILCSPSGCVNDDDNAQIPHHHRFFQSLEACGTHLADPYWEVIFPPDNQGAITFILKTTLERRLSLASGGNVG